MQIGLNFAVIKNVVIKRVHCTSLLYLKCTILSTHDYFQHLDLKLWSLIDCLEVVQFLNHKMGLTLKEENLLL